MSDPSLRPSSWIWLLLGFLLVSFLLLNKGDVFSINSDIEDYFIVIPWWFLAIWALYLLVQFISKKNLSPTLILSYWTFAGLCALFHWVMIKHDPHPYKGLIDEVVKRDVIERSRVADSLEWADGSADSTIVYHSSIDTAEDGVYIWLNGKRILLRKFGESGSAWRSDLDREAIRQMHDTLRSR